MLNFFFKKCVRADGIGVEGFGLGKKTLEWQILHFSAVEI